MHHEDNPRYRRPIAETGRDPHPSATHLLHGHTASFPRGDGTRAVVISPTYSSWSAMRCRCLNPKHPAFHRYGGRGITVCQEWDSFSAFLADMGERPDGHSLDRIDNDKGYCKENCRWSDSKQQVRNRACSRRITAFGITLTLPEWSERTGLHRSTIYHRLAKGMPPEEALTQPSRKKTTPKPLPISS